MVYLIAIDDQVGNGSLGIGAIYRDTKSVTTTAGSVTAFKSLLDVVDVIVQQLNMGAGTDHTNAERAEPMLCSVEVANLQTFNSHIILIVNGEHALPTCGGEMSCIEDRRFTWVIFESNK